METIGPKLGITTTLWKHMKHVMLAPSVLWSVPGTLFLLGTLIEGISPHRIDR
jgi:hypothetical protein